VAVEEAVDGVDEGVALPVVLPDGDVESLWPHRGAEAAQQLDERGVLEIVDDEADGARPVRRERRGGLAAAVSELGDGVLDGLPLGLSHEGGVVEHERHE